MTVHGTTDERQSTGLALRVEDVSARYGPKEVLANVSLRVAAGEFVTLLGLNGAGKSTLLRVIAGALRPTAGTVHLGETDVTRERLWRRARRGLGYMMQSGAVFPNLTVAENIAVAAGGSPDGLGRFPELHSLAGRRAGWLSGGERHMLALAMVLARNPRAVLLDEPTAGLSPPSAAAFFHFARRLHAAGGVTVLLVEHRVREALAVCQRAVAMADGRIVGETSDPAAWTDPRQLSVVYQTGQADSAAHKTHEGRM